MSETLYIIIAMFIMFIVTLLPRAIPIVFVSKKINVKFIKSFLYYVPYAVLSSLTFPAVFYSVGNEIAAIIATAVVIVLAFFKQKMIIIAIVAVLLVLLLGFII